MTLYVFWKSSCRLRVAQLKVHDPAAHAAVTSFTAFQEKVWWWTTISRSEPLLKFRINSDRHYFTSNWNRNFPTTTFSLVPTGQMIEIYCVKTQHTVIRLILWFVFFFLRFLSSHLPSSKTAVAHPSLWCSAWGPKGKKTFLLSGLLHCHNIFIVICCDCNWPLNPNWFVLLVAALAFQGFRETSSRQAVDCANISSVCVPPLSCALPTSPASFQRAGDPQLYSVFSSRNRMDPLNPLLFENLPPLRFTTCWGVYATVLFLTRKKTPKNVTQL